MRTPLKWERTGELYRPSNGTEGLIFDADWCEHCERDREYRDNPDADAALGCQLIARAFAYDIDDPSYPKEWIELTAIASDGLPLVSGECTAFEPRRNLDQRQPSVAVRDDKTMDMFT